MEDLGKDLRIPLKIMEQHYDSYGFIVDAISEQKLPANGNTIIRLAALIDEIVPYDIQILSKLNVKLGTIPNSDFGIEDWIKKGVEDGFLQHIVWVKPPWSQQVEDGHYDLQNNVTLDVKTLGCSVFNNCDENYSAFKEIYQKYISNKTPYILDITLNFFSADSPFAQNYTKVPNFNEKIQEIFKPVVPELKEHAALMAAAEERANKIRDLKSIFDHLREFKKMPDCQTVTEEYNKIEKLRNEMLEYYKEDDIDWKDVYDSALIGSLGNLPVHHTKEEDIIKLIDTCLAKMLDTLDAPPSLILIALMYEYDQYTTKNCQFILDYLTEFFNKRFNVDVFRDDD